MANNAKHLIQDVRAYTQGQQAVHFDLSEYAPARLVALQASGGAAVAGNTLSLYVTYELPERSHVIALTGDVTLAGTLWQVEFLPWGRPVRQSDLIHIVPIWPPILVPEAKLHVISLASLSDVWINTATLVMEPLP